MGWDVCSSPPWVPMYPYRMLQKWCYILTFPSEMQKSIITQKVFESQHTQNKWFKPLQMLFPCANDIFSILSGGVKETAKISHTVDFYWANMHQNGLIGNMYLGFKACWIQWHLLWSLYDKWFMKNHNFRRSHRRKWGSKPWTWDGMYAAVLLGSHCTPIECFRTLYLDLPIKNAKRP